jgi:DNA-binding transcriptional LysR family regulator
LSGRVVISTSPTLVNAYLPRAISLFRRSSPSVQVSIQSLPTPLAIDRVARREADFGVVYAPILDHGVEAEDLAMTEIACAVLKTHRLARKRQISSSDLAGETVISLGPTTMLGMMIEEESRRAGVAAPVIGIEASSSITACLLASEGAGIALIDRTAAITRKFNDLAFRAFVPRIAVPIKLIYPRQRPRSRATVQLSDTLKKVSARDR